MADSDLKSLLARAQRGDERAQHELGNHYHSTRDLMEAVKWWKIAAAQGNLPALFSLGSLYGAYAEREGFKQDWVEAYYYLSLINETHVRAGHRVDDGGVVAEAANHLTSEQKAEVEKRVHDWKPTSTSPKKP